MSVRIDPEQMDRHAMLFVIEGKLWAQPLPLSLYLETELDLETGTVTSQKQLASCTSEAPTMDPRILRYYNRELQHVREMGAEFAREYPKIAGRLGSMASSAPIRMSSGCSKASPT